MMIILVKKYVCGFKKFSLYLLLQNNLSFNFKKYFMKKKKDNFLFNIELKSKQGTAKIFTS